MATSPLRLSNSEALSKSQEAGKYIQRDVSATIFTSIPFLSSQDSTELWTNYESLLYSCLRTGDDKAAHFCMEKLAGRFGKDDERIKGLRGLYQEAMAEDKPALLHVLHEYDAILAEDPTNTPVRKRRVALLRSLSKEEDAINALVELLAFSPTDVESWAELASLYVVQGLYQQAEFCLEEILLSVPNAWNIHARLGEILYISAATSQDRIGSLAESVRRFCRSIELCDRYVRGYYGLKLVCNKILDRVASGSLMSLIPPSSQSATKASLDDNHHELPTPTIHDLQKLYDKATSILAETASHELHTRNLAFLTDALKPSTSRQQ
ncbi:MAG: hypothetical protein Q9219_007372 [cf. Caloplaca sp. 3 TL-2023]